MIQPFTDSRDGDNDEDAGRHDDAHGEHGKADKLCLIKFTINTANHKTIKSYQYCYLGTFLTR